MNNKNKQDALLFTLISIVFLTILPACSSLFAENMYEYPVAESISNYTIDPNTILDSLDQGQADVFTLETATPEAQFIKPEKGVYWDQDDYLSVAQAFHEYIKQEPTDSWILHRMRFSVMCENTSQGYHFGGFQYYKIEGADEQRTRYVHEITIAPLYDSVNSFERELSPVQEQWEPIELSQGSISAEDAILTAEREGGYQARSSVSNACEIDLLLAPGSAVYDGWIVSYTSEDGNVIFKIFIDPITGKHDVVKP